MKLAETVTFGGSGLDRAGHLRTRPDLKLALHAAFKENLRNKLTLANQRSLAHRTAAPLETQ